MDNDGPYYDDFEHGMTIPPLPAVTVTEADNVAYRMITGDQHFASADQDSYQQISGSSKALVNPGLVMQFAIGQTTNATRKAIANLYYRSVRILRSVEIGETLKTTTTVLGLSDAKPKDGQHRGKVWLGIETSTDRGPVVQRVARKQRVWLDLVSFSQNHLSLRSAWSELPAGLPHHFG